MRSVLAVFPLLLGLFGCSVMPVVAPADAVRTSPVPAAPLGEGFSWTPDLGAPGQVPAAFPPPAPSLAPSLEPKRDLREPTEWRGDRRLGGADRVAHARNNRLATVKAMFEEAGVSYPPHDTLLRAYKQENELELWAAGKDQDLKLVATYSICAASGGLGPKRREGDLQVPEGFYKIGYFDPTSAFHLAMLVDYPNASDRIRGGPTPGGEILIHGSCASIGCLSMGDERIEEIYLVGWAAFMSYRPVAVHIFPARDFDALLADDKLVQHHAFWSEIRVGHDAFDGTHRLPRVTIAPDGAYQVQAIP
jgi:hypothetical protein